MIDLGSRAAELACIGFGSRPPRHGPKGDSGRATDRFGPWRSGAARRDKSDVGGFKSIIYTSIVAARALSSMNLRRYSTTSPISIEKI